MNEPGARPSPPEQDSGAPGRIRLARLRNPAVWLPFLLFLLWLAACWFGTGSHFAAESRENLKTETAAAHRHLDEMAAGVKRMIALRRGVASTLARDADIRAALKRGTPALLPPASPQDQAERKRVWSQDPGLAAVSRALDLASHDLSLSVLYVLDTSGNCIAASNLEAPDSFIAGNFREREYFQIAIRGQTGRQFAVGKVSKVAGLYFSAPVMEGDRVLGIVVGKIDVPVLAPWLTLADGLLLDDYGVVILARDKSLEMHALPEAPALRMDPALRLTRYLRRDFPRLDLTPDPAHGGLTRLPERDAPQLFLKKDIAEVGLAVALLWPLPQIAREAQERQQNFWILALLGALALGAGSATLLYLSNRSRARRILMEKEQRYHLIVDSAAEGFWMVGPDRLTQDVNPALCAMLGYSREEFLGKSPLEFTDEENREILRQQLGNIDDTSSRFYDIQLRRKDGNLIPVFFHASTHFDGAGKVLMAFAFITDLRERKRAEQALREAADNLARAQAIAHLGSWRRDLARDKLICSEETARIFGLAPEAPLEDSFWDSFLAPSDRERRRAALGALLTGTPYDLEFPIQVAGQVKWLRERVEVARGQDGQALACHGTLQDITVAKAYATELELHRNHLEERVAQRTGELKSAEARYRSVVEIAPDGFLTVGEDQHILEVNDAYVRRSGYSRKELLGMTVADLDCARTPSEIQTNIEALARCGALRMETRHRTKDGAEWPAEVAISYWKEGRLVFAFLRDITERKAMEAAQERARQEAQALARTKSEFLANMSHEIRTPLNGVLGLAQVGFRGNEGRKAQLTFGRILESGRLLLGVVNDILDFSKIEAGRMEVERVPVNVYGLLRQALALHGERAQAKGITLTLEKGPNLPVACVGDPLRLAQVLANLLSNAVKFTESGQVTLRAALETEDGRETLVFRVTDTGIGMSRDQIGRLFTPFEQADGSTTRRFGGTGLGLAISRSMAQLMGGEIRVDSQVGQGSRFELRLPFQAPAPGEMASGKNASSQTTSAPKGAALAGLTLLAAEDNDVNRLVLEEMLVTEGARLDLVENGRLAVERIVSAGPDYYDLVLMDVQMPEMDGMEATRRIRELAPRLPIIGQTAHALPEEKERCLEAGMVDHIAKPLEHDDLIAAILRHARI